MKEMDSVVREGIEEKKSVAEMAKVQEQIPAKITELDLQHDGVLTGQRATLALVEGCTSERE